VGRKNLTDRTIKALKPAPASTTQDWWDLGFPGFGVRVSDTGRRTFVLAARYAGSPNPTRRRLGLYGPLTLEHARDKARAWLKLIEKGIDPEDDEKRRRAAEQRKRKNTFAAVAEDFIAEKLPHERRGAEAERDLRGIFIPAWGGRPITEITELDVLGIIKSKVKSTPVRARNLLSLLKRFFAWAIEQRHYDLQLSPCGRLKANRIIGEKVTRQRELAEGEIFAFWRAVERMPYPHGPVYKLLLLTGLRLNEVADARWSEFDQAVVTSIRRRKAGELLDWSKLEQKHLRWTIPAARMKGMNNKAKSHAVPLNPDMLECLPDLQNGDCVFSTSGGAKPVWMSGKVKQRLDDRMLLTLRARARLNGDDPHRVELDHWTNHDLRRVVRSNLSRLRIQDNVAEAVLAHTPAGIQKTYNVDNLFEQKAEALAAWAARLRSIVEPPPANVINLKARG
jgi:integrase